MMLVILVEIFILIMLMKTLIALMKTLMLVMLMGGFVRGSS